MSMSVPSLLSAAMSAVPETCVLVDDAPRSLTEVERCSRSGGPGVLGDLAAARRGLRVGATPESPESPEADDDLEVAQSRVHAETVLCGSMTHGSFLATLGDPAPDLAERLGALHGLLSEVSALAGFVHGEAVVREEDGERLGVAVAMPAGTWQAAGLTGHPVGPPGERAEAEDALLGAGLSWLADRWELWLDETWVSAQIVEAAPTRMTVQLVDLGLEGRYGERVRLPVPVGARLRPVR